MSLYANLLNPKADPSASISGAPVLYDNDDAAAKKEVNPGMPGQQPTFSLSLSLEPGSS